MISKKIFAMASMVALSCVAGINVTCDRKSHYYHVGENAEIRISCDKDMPLDILLTSDGEAVLDRRTIQASATEPYVFNFTLGQPGVLRCLVKGDGKESLLGMAFDPEQILPVLPEPADFLSFWEKAGDALDAIPANFKMTELTEDCTDEYLYYDVECDNVNGTKHYGYLKLPRTDKKVPLLIYVEGAGVGQEQESFKEHNQNVEKFIPSPVASLVIGVHRYKPMPCIEDHRKQHAEYVKQFKQGEYWLENIDAQDLTDNFFYRAILGCKRICDQVSALPQIDRGHIAYLGASQGGMFGLYLTALCPQIRAAFCGVPAFCDCGGPVVGRHTPTCQIGELRNHAQFLRYFDAANFARHITVPVFISAGYIDTTCTSSGIFAAANCLAGPKLVYHKVDHGHMTGPVEYEALYWTYVARFLLGD